MQCSQNYGGYGPRLKLKRTAGVSAPLEFLFKALGGLKQLEKCNPRMAKKTELA